MREAVCLRRLCDSKMKLLIACGNRLREDDGAGHLLADALAAHWRAEGIPHRCIQVQQLVPELALEIASAAVDEVWFIDCRVARDAQDTEIGIRRLDAAASARALGHQLSPEALLLYARHLFDERPPDAQPVGWQITVPGFHFGHADTVSASCQAVLDNAEPAAIRVR